MMGGASLRLKAATVLRLSGSSPRGRHHHDGCCSRREGAPGTGPHRHAKRARWPCDADPGTSEEGSILGSFVRVPRQECFAPEDPVLGWDGAELFTKRIDRGNFFWPRLAEPGSSVTLSPAHSTLRP